MKTPNLKATPKLAKDIESVMNAVKQDKFEKGHVLDNKKIVVKSLDQYIGKKLKHDKSIYKDGNQITVKTGTEWSEIPMKLKKEISWSDTDFA